MQLGNVPVLDDVGCFRYRARYVSWLACTLPTLVPCSGWQLDELHCMCEILEPEGASVGTAFRVAVYQETESCISFMQ